jgi:hypothetical protein
MPGVRAIPVTVGTTLIILAGMNGQSTTGVLIFENRLSRFIGRISYSLYLWHWPIVVFYEFNTVHTDIFEKLALLLASLSIGAISWWLIEMPFSRIPIGRPGKIVAFGDLASAMLVAISFLILATGGFEWRFSPEQVAIARPATDQDGEGTNQADCFLKTSKMKSLELFDFDSCVDDSSVGGKILLIGDSHMNSVAPGFREVFSETSISQVGASKCRPMVMSQGDSTCLNLMNFVTETLLKSGSLETLILAARWKFSEIEEISSNLEKINGYVKRVIFIGPIVEYRQSLPRLLAFNSLDDQEGVKKWSKIEEKRALDAAMKVAIMNIENVKYVSIIDAMCDGAQCMHFSKDGRPIQTDYGHLSWAGAVDVVRRFRTMGYLEGL